MFLTHNKKPPVCRLEETARLSLFSGSGKLEASLPLSPKNHVPGSIRPVTGDSVSRQVRTSMPGGVGAEKEKLPTTRMCDENTKIEA